jgi:hypothetical protein
MCSTETSPKAVGKVCPRAALLVEPEAGFAGWTSCNTPYAAPEAATTARSRTQRSVGKDTRRLCAGDAEMATHRRSHGDL